MSEIVFCTIVIAFSLVAIVAITGMTIYNLVKVKVIAEKKEYEAK